MASELGAWQLRSNNKLSTRIGFPQINFELTSSGRSNSEGCFMLPPYPCNAIGAFRSMDSFAADLPFDFSTVHF